MGSLSVDDDLDVVWAQAMERYEDVTRISLKGHGDFSAISNNITRNLERSKSGNRVKAQAIMGNIMTCLQKFGGIVATAAGVVFPGANQTFNAVNLVISAAQQYQKVLDGFTTLMERSVAFLDRLNVYLGEKSKSGTYLDPRLRKDAYAVLSHFLGVLAASYNLSKSKWQKTKTVLNIVLFNDDAGVSASLTQMETLVGNLCNTSIAVIVKDLEGLSKYMTESQEEILRHEAEILRHAQRTEEIVERTETTVQQLKGDQDRQKNLEKIKKALLIKDEPWTNEHRDKARFRIDGTGKWLLERNPAFRRWIDVHDHNINTITVTAKEGFGKSFVSSHVIDHLLEFKRRAGGSYDRITVAYYYFAKESKDESVERCLGSIVYQIAASNNEYAKAAANVCDQAEGLGRASELWKRLVIDLEASLQGTFFVVVDAFSTAGDGDASAKSAMASIASRAMTPNEMNSFRLFITGHESEIGSIPFENHSTIPAIALGRPRPRLGLQRRASRLNEDDWQTDDSLLEPLINEEDLVAFAKSRIADMCKENADLATILQDPELDAPAKLAKGVRGDYKNLQIKLNAISASDGDQQVKAIIDQAREDRAQSLGRIVQNMNATLTSDELEELNELLKWVLGGYSNKPIDLLQAALRLTTGKKHWLRTHIDSKFSALLAVDSEGDVTCADDLREILTTNEDIVSEEPAWKRPNMELQKSEVAIVRRVVKTFCGDDLYEKFDFESFFNQRAGGNVKRIQIEDENTMHMAILDACLKALYDSNGDDTFKILRLYASSWLHEHLKAIDLLQADKDGLRDIGSKLALLLYDGPLIDVWWDPLRLRKMRMDFILDTSYISALADALRNPLVAVGFRDNSEVNTWIKVALSSPEGDYRLLSRVAERLADRWFGKSLCDPDTVLCSLGIMAKIWNEKFATDADVTVELIDLFAQWSQAHTSVDVTSAHRTWRKASLFTLYDYNQQALVACQQAESELPDDWGLLLLKAKAHVGLEQYREAIDCLHSYKALDYKYLNVDKIYTGAYWEQVILLEGQTHVKLEDYVSGAACFELLLTHHFDDGWNVPHQAAVALISLWATTKAYQSTIDLLRRWKDAKDDTRGLEYWMQGVGPTQRFHEHTLLATSQTGQHQLVHEIYVSMLQTVDSNDKPFDVALWRCFYASLISYSSPAEQDQEEALEQWLELIQAGELDNDLSSIAWLSVMKLSRSLLDGAIRSGVVPMSEAAAKLVVRLEALTQMNTSVIRECRQGNDDPRLALIRTYFLAGDHTRARNIVKTRLGEIFDDWPTLTDEEALAERFDRLAQTFTVLNDDRKALAGWRLWQPKRSYLEAKDANGTLDEATPNTTLHQAEAKDNSSDGTADTSETTTVTEIRTEMLESFDTRSCDGCGKLWKFADDQWVCRHCLDVQLCPQCHTKLQSGELSPLVCDPDHHFLHLPPFDRALWKRTPPDMMFVGDELMRRDVWLDGLRKEWGLQPEAIKEHKAKAAAELRATRALARAITRWRRAALKKRSSK